MLVTPWAALGRKYYTEPVHQVHPWPALYFGCYDTVSWVRGLCWFPAPWCLCVMHWYGNVYLVKDCLLCLILTQLHLCLASFDFPLHPLHHTSPIPPPPCSSQAVWLQRFRIGRRVWAQRFPCLAVICALQRQRLMGSGNRETETKRKTLRVRQRWESPERSRQTALKVADLFDWFYLKAGICNKMDDV